ncbi:MAG: peptidylprolyl isomerase [Clostridia bacterium]|nr:peptidylprolyl isomerase [Clostridia bacterium]
MKKTFFRGISVLLAAVLTLSFVACGKIKPQKSKGDELKTVMTLDGQDIYFEELRYLTLNARRDMEYKYGKNCFADPQKGAEYKTELEDFVWKNLKKNAVIMTYARKLGIDENSDDVKKAVQDAVDSLADQAGGKDGYLKQLEENFMTDHLLRYNLQASQVLTLLQIKMIESNVIDGSDEAAKAAMEGDDFIRTLHVYIQNDEGEDIEANRQKAQTALDELNSGEKLTRVIGRYSEDFYMTTTDGYYFTYGEYDEAYEETAFSLNIGEHSGIVETSTGFFIICRLEKENEYIEKNFEALKERYLYAAAEAVLSQRSLEATIAMTDFGKSLDLTEIN